MSKVCLHIISKEEAKRRGMGRYFTGEPCKNEHVSERLVSSGRCCECNRLKQERRYREKREQILDNRKRHYEANKEQQLARSRKYREANREEQLERIKQWKQKNKEYCKEYRKQYKKQCYRNDPLFKVSVICRSMLHRLIRQADTVKESSTYETLGYSNEQLKDHIEFMFLEGMSWDNYGEWHIDHIYPVSRYIEDGETNPAVINKLDNLLPMWAEHNIAKGNKTLEEFLEIRPDLEGMYKLKESPSSGN